MSVPINAMCAILKNLATQSIIYLAILLNSSMEVSVLNGNSKASKILFVSLISSLVRFLAVFLSKRRSFCECLSMAVKAKSKLSNGTSNNLNKWVKVPYKEELFNKDIKFVYPGIFGDIFVQNAI